MKIVEVVTLAELGVPEVTKLDRPLSGYVESEPTQHPAAVTRLMKTLGLKYPEAVALAEQQRAAARLARELLRKQPKAKKPKKKPKNTTLAPGKRKVRKTGSLIHPPRPR